MCVNLLFSPPLKKADFSFACPGKFLHICRMKKAEREERRKETLSKYFFDLSKLTYTALVLGGLVTVIQNSVIVSLDYIIIISGSFCAFSFALFASRLIK
jgi:hypothetical protein